MTVDELSAADFMEALLRAVLILSDRKGPPAGEIDILSSVDRDSGEKDSGRRMRCRITLDVEGGPASGARVRIVYPEAPGRKRGDPA